MIYSTGIDLVDIDRIRNGYRRYGDKYLGRLFSQSEIDDLTARKSGMIATMAGKFAAKEAVMKSLGVLFDSGVAFRDIEILNRSTGMPYVRLPGRLKTSWPANRSSCRSRTNGNTPPPWQS